MTVPHLSISTLVPVNNTHVRQYEMFCQTIQLNYYMADKSKENNKLLLCRSLKNLIHSECTWHLFTNGSWRLQNEPLLNDATERTSTSTRRDTSSMNTHKTINTHKTRNSKNQRCLWGPKQHRTEPILNQSGSSSEKYFNPGQEATRQSRLTQFHWWKAAKLANQKRVYNVKFMWQDVSFLKSAVVSSFY